MAKKNQKIRKQKQQKEIALAIRGPGRRSVACRCGTCLRTEVVEMAVEPLPSPWIKTRSIMAMSSSARTASSPSRSPTQAMAH